MVLLMGWNGKVGSPKKSHRNYNPSVNKFLSLFFLNRCLFETSFPKNNNLFHTDGHWFCLFTYLFWKQ